MKNLMITLIGISMALFSQSQCSISLITLNSNLPNCSDSLISSGDVTIDASPPATGFLIIENCQGVRDTIAQAPFTIGTYSFNLNTEANGQSCDFTVFFSDDNSCQQVVNLNLLQSIGSDEAGTFNVSHSGNGIGTPTIPDGNKYILCNQDQIFISNNNDFDIPDLSPHTPDPSDIYDPGIIYMVYSCPPSPGGMGITPWIDDPCWVGFLNDGDNVILTNDGGSLDPIIGALLNSNNEVYLVPMTFYDKTNIQVHADCYDLSIEDVQHVQYLNPIEFSNSQTCTSDTAEITISGGYPEFYPATEYTASNLSAGFFINNTCGHNGTIKIGGLSPGEIFSFDLIDQNGCPVSYSNLPNSGSDSTIVACSGDLGSLILNNYLDGSTSGVWDNSYPEFDSITSILQLNGLSGNYSFTYQVGDSCFQSTSQFTVIVEDYPTLTLGSSFLVCHGAEALLTSVSSGTVTWEDEIVDGVPFTPDSTNYYVANAESLNGCITTDSILIEVELAPEYEFVITDTVYCPGEIIDVSINNGTNCSIILGLDTVTSTSCTAQFQFDEDGCHELSLIDQTINGCEWDTTFIYSICVETGSDAGDDSSIVISNVVSVDLDDYLTGDVNGSWTPYTFTGLGSFDHTTGLLDVSGADTGDYVFEYIVDSCGLDTAYIYVHVDPFAGINESFIDDVSLYPNPAYDKININCSACIPIKIIDANGKEVQVLQGIKKVDISKLSPGMYYSIIQSYSGKIISMKFLVK